MSTLRRNKPRSKDVSKSPGDSGQAEDQQWRSVYLRLVDFQRVRGHCDVPLQSSEYRGVAAWLATQRELAAKGALTEARRSALEDVGVDFSPESEDSSPAGLEKYRKSIWEMRYEEMVEFQKEHGHTRVTKDFIDWPGLGRWRHHQREMYRQGELLPARKAKLDALGFEFEEPMYRGHHRTVYLDGLWELRFEELSDFKRRHGNCQVGRLKSENPGLVKWVCRQRGLRRSGELDAERAQRLTALGFDWNEDVSQADSRWEARYWELWEYKSRYGHCRVSKSQAKEWPGLYSWRHHQREKFRAGVLEPEHKRRLDVLEFEWAEPDVGWLKPSDAPRDGIPPVRTEFWDQNYKNLQRYRERLGHCEVPCRWKDMPALGKWVVKQRKAYHDGELSLERVQLLDAIGFSWESTHALAEERWDSRYAQLVEYHSRHGHCRVTKADPNAAFGLAHWRHHQRKLHATGKLSSLHRAKLDALGFEWEEAVPQPSNGQSAQQSLWEQRCKELVAFHQRFGHFRVHDHWRDHRLLARWLRNVRHDYATGTLEPGRTKQLEEIGFPLTENLSCLDLTWNKRYEDLQLFHARWGHCHVLKSSAEFPSLATWLEDQLQQWREGILPPEHKVRLQALGVTPTISKHPIPSRVLPPPIPFPEPKHSWSQHIRDLKKFQAEFGHPSVPLDYEPNPALGKWVASVRRQFRTGTLAAQQQAELEALGFLWKAVSSHLNTEAAWRMSFKQLQQFHRQWGHTRVTDGWKLAPDLWKFCEHQCYLERNGRMQKTRRAQLEALGFDWDWCYAPAQSRAKALKDRDAKSRPWRT